MRVAISDPRRRTVGTRDALLDGVDFLIDLYTSGRSYDMPFLTGYHAPRADADSLGARAARAFGALFVWGHPGRTPGRTISVVSDAIYVEAPGSGATDAAAVDAYAAVCFACSRCSACSSRHPPWRALVRST